MSGSPRSLRLVMLALGLLISSQASVAQIVLDLDTVAPGSDELVLRFATEAGDPGPFHLMRKTYSHERLGGPADALPLGAADTYLSDVVSPVMLSLTGEGPPPKGVLIYSIRSESGACSNTAYIVRRDDPWETCESHIPVMPWRGGARRASEILALNPGLAHVSKADRIGGVDRSIFYRRDSLLGFVGVDFFVGMGESYLGQRTWQDADRNILTLGASDAGGAGIPIASGVGPGGEPASLAYWLSAPVATDLEAMDEVHCGYRWGWAGDSAAINEDPTVCSTGLYDAPAVASGLEDTSAVTMRINDACAFQQTLLRSFVTSPSEVEFRFESGSGMLFDTSMGFLFSARREVATAPRTFAPPDAGAPPACRCSDTDGDGVDDCTESLDGTDPMDPTSLGPDHDGDGVPDASDLCPGVTDPLQLDTDGDGWGDACDPCPMGAPSCEDADGDGILIGSDTCPDNADPSNRDQDWDAVGDVCDNCPQYPNTTQADADGDGFGDLCDDCEATDDDQDRVCDDADNCVGVANADQNDEDLDSVGDACDVCPAVPDPDQADTDGDSVGDACDCNPEDAAPDAPPLAIADLLVAKGAELSLTWTSPPYEPGGPAVHDVLSGGLAALRSVGPTSDVVCLARDHEGTQLDATRTGDVWFLVRREYAACALAPWSLDVDPPLPVDPCL